MNDMIDRLVSRVKLFRGTSFLLMFFLPIHVLWAENYFISSVDGNDMFNGLSINSPYKTIEKINQLDLMPGDTVFLKSGEKYYGTIEIESGGNSLNPIVITSYGTGELPLISGAKTVSNFEDQGGLISKIKTAQVYALFVNDQFILPARYPADNYLYFDGGGRNFMVDDIIDKMKYDLVNSTIRMRIKNWSYENKKVTKVSADTVFFDRNLWSNNYEKYTCDAGGGYFFNTNKQLIKDD